jgi:hypothetical protein
LVAAHSVGTDGSSGDGPQRGEARLRAAARHERTGACRRGSGGLREGGALGWSQRRLGGADGCAGEMSVGGAVRHAVVGGWRPATGAGEMRERRGRWLGAGGRRRGEEGEEPAAGAGGCRGEEPLAAAQGRGCPWRL